jgi:hypothetical protein
LPKSGRYIVARYDEEFVVDRAYHPAIGLFAAKRGYFGGSSFSKFVPELY